MRPTVVILLLLAVVAAAGPVAAQEGPVLSPGAWRVTEADWPPTRGPGWYFSLWKVILPLLVMLAWLPAVEWVNQDCQRLKLGWKKWNAIVVFTFFGCFLLHYVMPNWWLAFPLVLVGTTPVFVYVKKRNSATSADDRVLTKDHLRRLMAEKLKPMGIKVQVEAKGADLPLEIIAQGGANAGEERAISIKITSMKGADPVRRLLIDAIEKRSGTILFDYSPQAVAVKYQIDGVFHDAPGRDRAAGDAMLEVLKTAAFLNPAERVKRQSGQLELKMNKSRWQARLTSQGTPTGERVVLQLDDGAPHKARLETIGMRQKMQDDLKALLANKAGLVLVSAPPGRGLTTLMTATTTAVDRFMRSAVGVESAKTNEMRVENVVLHRFDPDQGESPATVLPAVIRQYPDVFIVPDLVDAKTVEILCEEVKDEERLVVAAIGAKEASEALLRVLMLKVPIKAFAPVVTAVVCGRLVRKLCDDCKQAYTPSPQLLQQLRLPAGKVTQLYKQYQPPAQQPGGKKPPPPCATCSGIGYHGRTGLYELLVVNDDVRAALMNKPTVETVRQAAQKAGMHTLQEEAVMLVVQGITSLEEVMRVMKEQKE